MKLIECVPNFSEGRDLETVHAIRDAIASIRGVTVLHMTADASHNRSVITFVTPYENAVDAAFAGIQTARDRIDLTQHRGVHPRIGAADVIPFIPLDGATMDDCVELARVLGERVGSELNIPVYLYERAATRSSRQNLADVRRGGFEGLQLEIDTNPDRVPDFGPLQLHPTAGAVAIGARPFLVAFNVYLGGAENLLIAKEVARVIRTSGGGLPYVKALGLEVAGQAQVSMNLVDIERTPLSVVFEAVRTEAIARGVQITRSEIIGLLPEQVLYETAAKYLRLRQPVDEHILERRILNMHTPAPETLAAYRDAVGSDTPAPGGGSVAAYVGALAAALTKMVSSLTLGRQKYAAAHEQMHVIGEEADQIGYRLTQLSADDTAAYLAVMAAYARPRATDEEVTLRRQSLQDALLTAAGVPLEVARLCVRITELLVVVAEHGNSNAVTDAGTAALMANAACHAAVLNVRVNVRALKGVAGAEDLMIDATYCIATTSQLSGLVLATVEHVLTHGAP